MNRGVGNHRSRQVEHWGAVPRLLIVSPYSIDPPIHGGSKDAST